MTHAVLSAVHTKRVFFLGPQDRKVEHGGTGVARLYRI
jgi:hypothetical protein